MKVESWEHYDLDYTRMWVASLVIGGSAGLGALALTFQIMGPLAVLIGGAVGVGFVYFLLTAPRRKIQGAALAQAREAPVLAAAATIHLKTTGSRSKSLLSIDAQDEELRDFLQRVRRMILLGVDPHRAVEHERGRPVSDSVRRILGSVAEASAANIVVGSVELEGIQSSSALGEETKLPVFVAITFFAPIMLILFSALTKNTGAFALITILLLQVVVLDLTFSVSSPERRLLGS